MDEVLKNENLAPEQINSIDELIQEGKSRVNITIMVGAALGPAIPEADLYFKRALGLMNLQGAPNPEKEYEARLWLAVYLAMNWKKEEALPHFERCVELKPQDIEARIGLAKVYGDVKRPAESARQYREATRLSNFSSLSKYSNLVRVLAQYLKAT